MCGCGRTYRDWETPQTGFRKKDCIFIAGAIQRIRTMQPMASGAAGRQSPVR